MPSTLTYPGVYIEEIPSGVRTITGVATSITAFIGRALRGPTDKPITINSYGDFERIFGGLWKESTLGYAVRDFYLNGGSQAIIVRLYSKETGTGAKPDKSTLISAILGTTFRLEAAYEGAWGNDLSATLDIDVSDEVVKRLGVEKGDLFNLTVTTVTPDNPNGITERFVNLTLKPSTRQIKDTLEQESRLVRWAGVYGISFLPLKDATQAVTAKEAALAQVKKDSPSDSKKVSEAEKALEEALGKIAPLAALKEAIKAVTNKTEKEAALAKANNDNPPDSNKVTEAEKAVKEAKQALSDVSDIIPSSALKEAIKAVTEKETTLATAKTAHSGDLTHKDVTDAEKAVKEAEDNLAKVVSNIALNPSASKPSDGVALTQNSFLPLGGEANKKGLYALEDADLFNLLCIPPYTQDTDIDEPLISAAVKYCEKRRAMFIIDPPSAWKTKDDAKAKIGDINTTSKNAALYFPRLKQSDPLQDNQKREFAPCGAVAGVMARTDTQRGVWKAPAGLEATLTGVPELSVSLTDLENGELNPLGINCLRTFPAAGRIVWGARTRNGDDRLASEWKYIPVRRLALFIEESLYRGTQWVVFEPNDEPLWAQIRLNVGAFMQNLFRQGAFQGSSPRDAYFVKCDKETTPQNDINLGIVNIVVGFAPLKPAEFVVIKLQQMAGQIAV